MIYGRFLVENANHYRRDVVVSSVYVRLLDQSVDDSFGLGAGRQQLLNPAVFDHPGKAIAREKEAVPDPRLAIEHIGLDLVRHADATRDDVALRMPSCLLRGE